VFICGIKKLVEKFIIWFARNGTWDMPVYVAKSSQRIIVDLAFLCIRSSDISSCSMDTSLLSDGGR
jgi:hypothetical protein